MIKLTIPGNPISVNHYLGNYTLGKRVVRFKTKKAKEYQELCKKIYKGKIQKSKLKMSIFLFFGDKRRRDVDNYSKVILDSLQGIAYDDDSQIYELFVKKEIDKNNPRVEVELGVI